jgi:ATP-dependent Lhr-like helicase
LEAETSSGKTEAVFLPLLAWMSGKRRDEAKGFSLLYISPLRALINDQVGRIGPLAEAVGLDVHRWHSGVGKKEKDRARRQRRGILLTTPESIEGFFVRIMHESPEIEAISKVSAVVIDELHAFFDTARGRHLQSLLHRLDLLAGRKIPRLGLSATLSGIDEIAREVLRPKSDVPIKFLRPEKNARKIQIGLKVFIAPDREDASNEGKRPSRLPLNDQFANQLIKDFRRDTRGLVFCNSRGGVDLLQERASAIKGSGALTFEAHHSSIPDAKKEATERKMRNEVPDAPKQMVVICTNTLELGIDIGQVQRVVQIDPTYTVAALRQRVGRSGRRGDRGAEGLIYVGERELSTDAHPLDQLRIKTFQAIATTQLSLDGSFEEPNHADLHLSTLYHQVISVLREGHPKTTEQLHRLLVLDGPWHAAPELSDRAFFARFLETMTEIRFPLVERVSGDEWRLRESKEVSRPAYAVFSTPPEYTVYFNAQPIGHLPMTISYRVGDTFVLANGRWRVLNVNDHNRSLTVTKASSAGAPRYGGAAQTPSGLVAARMRAIYQGEKSHTIEGDETARQMMKEGRRAFKKFGLDKNRFLEHGRDVILFPWAGSRRAQTLVLLLRREGMKASIENFAIAIEAASAADVKMLLAEIRRQPLPEADELAREARQLQADRFDRYLIPYHQRLAFGRRFLTRDGVKELVDELLAAEAAAV